ncbi:MAG TPA: aldehyde dehydrogenase family protein [Lacipirellulaceae bacterium]|nr:aldehyde dehydrogenase family protein [Lacipirellulaceae bacterium]
MLRERYPYYLANRPQQPNAGLEVTNKYTGEVASHVALANKGILDQAIAAAAKAAAPMRRLAAWQRKAVLNHLAVRCRERAEEFAQQLTIEAGKPIKYSRLEVTRLIDTVEIAAEEAVRLVGETLPIDISERAAGYRGMWKRVPLGPCALITPWNFPLNLVAHKIAPAIACGCPFVLKPASTTPIGALTLGEILAETDLPEGAFSILPLNTSDADAMVEDERIKKLSFTGSTKVGWALRDRARKKHVTLELGGNAACVIERDADLDDAVERNVFGGYYQSGQSCISVQRIYVHESVYGAFRDKFVPAVKALKMGNPSDEKTFIGPMISENDAKRIERTIQDAVKRGAKLLTGGGRNGNMVEPAVLENVPLDAEASCEEIFGPVTTLAPFSNFQQAVDLVNSSRYGLQAGIFTNDIGRIQYAWDELDVGGVMINEVPSFRVDHMPYGGTKDSGMGREGIRWAIDSMTEVRLMVIRSRPLNESPRPVAGE